MSRFATLDSIKKAAAEKKKDSDEEAPPARPGGEDYYVGGNSARGGGSGLSVVGPPGGEGGGGGSDFVQGIFQRARGGPSDLGNAAGEASGPSAGDAPPAGARSITMYRNGFTVDDGPFRALDDPANDSFLRDMARGVVPRELEAGVPPGQAVHVNLKDKRDEEYAAPAAPAYVAYSGEGKSLKSEGGGGSAAALCAGGGGGGHMPELDEGRPTTVLQVGREGGREGGRKGGRKGGKWRS
ncbi:ubx domain-containing protein [Nannochloropsis oceanica]